MHTSFLVTGFSNKLRCVRRGNLPSTSRSASSAKLLDVSIRVVRFGRLFGTRGSIVLIRFLARRRVCSRGERGKLERAVMSLSVKSIASWSCCVRLLSHIHITQYEKFIKGRLLSKGMNIHTFAAPKFSIAGIL